MNTDNLAPFTHGFCFFYFDHQDNLEVEFWFHTHKMCNIGKATKSLSQFPLL